MLIHYTNKSLSLAKSTLRLRTAEVAVDTCRGYGLVLPSSMTARRSYSRSSYRSRAPEGEGKGEGGPSARDGKGSGTTHISSLPLPPQHLLCFTASFPSQTLTQKGRTQYLELLHCHEAVQRILWICDENCDVWEPLEPPLEPCGLLRCRRPSMSGASGKRSRRMRSLEPDEQNPMRGGRGGEGS